jgi:NAD(P)-dependent dehydrogenase (short-subunit alcohol dehydrogenase family)
VANVVVVTGAGYGVGRAIAEAYGGRGAAVGLLARGRESLDAAAAAIERAGGRALSVPTDVADHDQVESAAARVESELGELDVWVNCAMATIFAPFHQVTPDEYRRATEVTYLGYVWGTMAALRRMRLRDRGTIVQVGSALAYRSIPLQAAYCGAKHAINGFTDSLRTELLHDRSSVRLTTVHLPALNTPQFEVGRSRLPRRPQPVPPIFDPELAADAVVWASENDRREVWVGGPTVLAIAGARLAPGLADLYLARTGYESQQTEEPARPGQPDNLFEPVAGVRGSRGRFHDRAKNGSVQLALVRNRDALLAALGFAAAAFALKRR